MSQRQPDEYPEHLNPFKKSSGIRGSFRQLKSNISKTFRKKEKEHKVELRSTNAGVSNQQNRQTVPATLRHPDQTQEYIGLTPALPRSRFSERVAKSKTLGTYQPQDTNPFDEEPNTKSVPNANEHRISNEGVDGPIRKHRRKKRAPLPPHRRGENGFLNVPDQHGSQWSVNSGDTDISSSNYTYCSETDLDMEPDNPEMVKNIQNITKEIEHYCLTSDAEDTVTTETVRVKTITEERHEDIIAVQELVVSSENDDEIKKDVVIQEVDCDSKEDKAVQNCDKIISENNIDNKAESSENIDIINEVEYQKNIKEIPNDVGDESMIIKENGCSKIADVVACPEIVVENVSCTTEENCNQIVDENGCSKIPDIVACPEIVVENVSCTTEENCNQIVDEIEKLEIVNNNPESAGDVHNKVLTTVREDEIVDDQNNNSSITNEIKQFPYADADINYCQIKSIYITGSRDDLDNPNVHFHESKSISISGSCDNILEASNNNQESVHMNKIRKNKLSKEVLLGSVENI